jgi:hypothetical protein
MASLAITNYSLAVNYYWLQLLMATCYVALVWAKQKTLSPTVLLLLHSNGNDIICLLCHCLATDDISCYAIWSCHTIYYIFVWVAFEKCCDTVKQTFIIQFILTKIKFIHLFYRLTIPNFIKIYWIVLKSMQADGHGLQWSSINALCAKIM